MNRYAVQHISVRIILRPLVQTTLAMVSKPCHDRACLDHQLAHLGSQAYQHLPLGGLALGKEMVLFD